MFSRNALVVLILLFLQSDNPARYNPFTKWNSHGHFVNKKTNKYNTGSSNEPGGEVNTNNIIAGVINKQL